MASKRPLTIALLCREAREFAKQVSQVADPFLYGKTDGKAVGTHVERQFRERLQAAFTLDAGNAAKGIDFPDLEVDLKVTSIRQPQSSCPFRSARQKVYGLGYHLLIFVYDKIDDPQSATGRLDIQHTIFVDAQRTGDFQTTRGLSAILQNDGNLDDVQAFLIDRNLPVDEIGARELAQEIVRRPPELGYLTISNAMQWRLQYGRVIEQAGAVEGIRRV